MATPDEESNSHMRVGITCVCYSKCVSLRSAMNIAQKQILEIDTGTGPSVRMVELAETLVKLKRSGNVWLFYYSFNTDTKISIKS